MSAPAPSPSDGASPSLAPSELAFPELASPELAPPELASPSLAPSELASPELAPPELASPSLAPSELASPSLAPSELAFPELAFPELASPEPVSSELLSPELDRYRAIQAFAERELGLAGQGDVDELASHAAGWDALTAGLPDNPPPSARSLLERATLLHERARIELLRIREALVSELADIGHVSRAAHGYTPVADRRPRVDQSA